MRWILALACLLLGTGCVQSGRGVVPLEHTPFPIETTSTADPEVLAFTLELRRPLDAEEQRRLRAAIETWRTRGVTVGYGDGHVAYVSDALIDGDAVRWWADVVTGGAPAVEALIDRIGALDLPVRRLILGWDDESRHYPGTTIEPPA